MSNDGARLTGKKASTSVEAGRRISNYFMLEGGVPTAETTVTASVSRSWWVAQGASESLLWSEVGRQFRAKGAPFIGYMGPVSCDYGTITMSSNARDLLFTWSPPGVYFSETGETHPPINGEDEEEDDVL